MHPAPLASRSLFGPARLLAAALALSAAAGDRSRAEPPPAAAPGALQLVAAARAQVGRTTVYDPAYVVLAYPGGDVPADRGACTDVLVRAFRDALNVDLQAEIHRDMENNFRAYPHLWGLSRTDKNIDHRRVPNLATYFRRQGMALPVSAAAADYLPGDVVTWMLLGKLPHVGIVSDRKTPDGARPLIIHNIGAGAQEEDILFAYPVTGHYRPGRRG